MDWIGIAAALAPVWGLLAYALLRLTGRIPKPPGVPPGRTGGMGRTRPLSGAPRSDAPYYARKLGAEAAEPDAEPGPEQLEPGEDEPGESA